MSTTQTAPLPSITLSRDDHAKLSLLVSAALASKPTAPLKKLKEELDRAMVAETNAVPSDVVTLNAHVSFEDLETNETEAYTITLPEQANVEQNRISILAPIGTALIGYRQGDIVNWQTPGGVRQLRIKKVTQPAA
ncbi:MAG TPA: nucleoside diphosphate kinase regulator [Opitutaceae bacterium]|nr:nucleoside diphosphate kinase regulator [Opitutaceae bacterium]